jgi:hypothetical protein
MSLAVPTQCAETRIRRRFRHWKYWIFYEADSEEEINALLLVLDEMMNGRPLSWKSQSSTIFTQGGNR